MVKKYVRDSVDFEYDLELAVYGKNAIMGPLEPNAGAVPHDICICCHSRVDTQRQAT